MASSAIRRGSHTHTALTILGEAGIDAALGEAEVWEKARSGNPRYSSVKFHSQLQDLARRGLVERLGERGSYRYRIVSAGLNLLELESMR